MLYIIYVLLINTYIMKTAYTINDMINYLVDVMGYSEQDFEESTESHLFDLIEDKEDFQEFIA